MRNSYRSRNIKHKHFLEIFQPKLHLFPRPSVCFFVYFTIFVVQIVAFLNSLLFLNIKLMRKSFVQGEVISYVVKIYRRYTLTIFLFCIQLKGPEAGSCMDDRFLVSGLDASRSIPPLCGFNSNQHSTRQLN
jgi:hypothetical protein